MHKTIRLCLIIATLWLLSGCGLSVITSRESNPVIQDYAGNPIANIFKGNIISTFATTASRRMVIVREHKKDGVKVVSTCAEPSPDVGEAFASAIADAIKIAAPIEGVPVELSNQYAKTIATEITPLIYRTQGLQLYRDAIHSLCIDKMNGWVKLASDDAKPDTSKNPRSYGSLRKHYFDETIKLITAELPVMQVTQESFFEHSKAGASKVDVGDVTKILNAVKPSE